MPASGYCSGRRCSWTRGRRSRDAGGAEKTGTECLRMAQGVEQRRRTGRPARTGRTEGVRVPFHRPRGRDRAQGPLACVAPGRHAGRPREAGLHRVGQRNRGVRHVPELLRQLRNSSRRWGTGKAFRQSSSGRRGPAGRRGASRRPGRGRGDGGGRRRQWRRGTGCLQGPSAQRFWSRPRGKSSRRAPHCHSRHGHARGRGHLRGRRGHRLGLRVRAALPRGHRRGAPG
mmetsp:Transcript_12504/g.37708  ORF Transcript_12504/g.37708 Transcript_12504/m.37708 type:complete len:229 (-) Transcript_12504:295-981(-)